MDPAYGQMPILNFNFNYISYFFQTVLYPVKVSYPEFLH